ncbi:hypothetical protein H310_13257 [Aphanomyces invadans]|uniref:Uncharacterized protein n=1 Tax=Aphanomyces invadans TaxID=157072 RepID=A0A024TG98_9STRA|nr:hypothetical protein H310_13257 [Aphanomyces invadans]ETV92357.1 hypothetical protein H310_13257 [Aphanomyces invadans]|eukprot:XP_008878908.1 hypothetical protein H310_13257 [Aphanomyces invadans]
MNLRAEIQHHGYIYRGELIVEQDDANGSAMKYVGSAHFNPSLRSCPPSRAYVNVLEACRAVTSNEIFCGYAERDSLGHGNNKELGQAFHPRPKKPDNFESNIKPGQVGSVLDMFVIA